MTRPDWCPQDVWDAALDARQEWANGPADIRTAIARAILAERERLIRSLEYAPSTVFEAMAAEQAAGEARNGHGRHSYRDMWLAGVRAIRGTL